MRCAAVVALGELGLSEERFSIPPTEVIEALISTITDSDRAVCSAAVVALGRIGNTQAISALSALAETTEANGSAVTSVKPYIKLRNRIPNNPNFLKEFLCFLQANVI